MLLTINIQRFLCNAIKSHVVKEPKEAVLYFLQDFKVNFDRGWYRISVEFTVFLTARCIDLSYSTYINDIIQYHYCQF